MLPCKEKIKGFTTISAFNLVSRYWANADFHSALACHPSAFASQCRTGPVNYRPPCAGRKCDRECDAALLQRVLSSAGLCRRRGGLSLWQPEQQLDHGMRCPDGQKRRPDHAGAAWRLHRRAVHPHCHHHRLQQSGLCRRGRADDGADDLGECAFFDHGRPRPALHDQQARHAQYRQLRLRSPDHRLL